MEVDRAAAKAAGYSDEEITKFEAQSAAARAAGYNETEIASYLNAEPPAEVAPPARNPDLEREVDTYFKGKDITPEGLEGLTAKYGLPIGNAADLVAYRKKYGYRKPVFDYKAAPSAMPSVAPDPQSEGVDFGNIVRSGARGALFDFNDEIEAGLRAPFSDLDYRQIKDSINADYDQWATANPGQALAGELTGGVASAFIPGVGLIGNVAKGVKALEGAGNLRKAWELSKAGMKSGAVTGALTGAGASKDMYDILPSTALGTGLGTVAGGIMSPAFAGANKIVRAGYRKATGAAPPTNRGEELGRGQILSAIERGPDDPSNILGEAALRNKYGVPYRLGDLSPELEKLTLATAGKPSVGQRGLIEDTYNRVTGTPSRVASQVRKAFPDANDYFKTEEEVLGNLRNTYSTLGEAAMNAGPVRDPKVMDLIHNPVMSKYWLKAKTMADAKVAAAQGRGEDPTKYKLALEMKPVLDAQGALVGLQPTGRKIPDVRTLDYLRRAMSDDIDSGFSGSSSAGKNAAGITKELREVLDSGLKTVPAYRTYLKAYSDEKSVEKALRLGRDSFGSQRPQEVKAFLDNPNLSAAERRAYGTGVVQHLLQPIENPQKLQNFAENIIGPNSMNATREKLKLVLPPREFDLMDAALSLEAKTFNQNMKLLSGNPEMARVNQALDESIREGVDAPAAILQLIANPTSPTYMARAVAHIARVLNHLPENAKKDKMYTEMARALKTDNVRDIARLLNTAEFERAARTAANEAQILKARTAAALAGKETAAMTQERTPNAPVGQLAPAGIIDGQVDESTPPIDVPLSAPDGVAGSVPDGGIVGLEPEADPIPE